MGFGQSLLSFPPSLSLLVLGTGQGSKVSRLCVVCLRDPDRAGLSCGGRKTPQDVLWRQGVG